MCEWKIKAENAESHCVSIARHLFTFQAFLLVSSASLCISSRQTDRSGWLTRFREVKLHWCHLDRQSSSVNTAGTASDLRRITLGWQRCEVMSTCDEIIMRAQLPACDVSKALAWLSTVELPLLITDNGMKLGNTLCKYLAFLSITHGEFFPSICLVHIF